MEKSISDRIIDKELVIQSIIDCLSDDIDIFIGNKGYLNTGISNLLEQRKAFAKMYMYVNLKPQQKEEILQLYSMCNNSLIRVLGLYTL